MPVYDYKCPEHGIFSELATIGNHSRPSPCPRCGDLAGRVIIAAPGSLTLGPVQREAYTRNERAQHQPRVFAARVGVEEERSTACGCSDNERKNSKALYTPTGEKIFPSARPWMISH